MFWNEIQIYGIFGWVVIWRVAQPLCAFFRFHSFVIFLEPILTYEVNGVRLQEVAADEVPTEDEFGGQEGDENDDDSTGNLEDPMEKKEEVNSLVPNLLFNLV